MLHVQKAKSSRESIPLLRITSILIVVFICWKGKVIRVVKLAQPLYARQVKGFLWPSPSRSYKLSGFSTTLLCRSSKRLLWPCLTHPFMLSSLLTKVFSSLPIARRRKKKQNLSRFSSKNFRYLTQSAIWPTYFSHFASFSWQHLQPSHTPVHSSHEIYEGPERRIQ